MQHATTPPALLRGLACYLVGGAVRDLLLGRPVVDRDWCVVGATADELRARRLKPVGHDFTVFLVPGTGDQVALARRVAADGGFASDPAIAIEEDLAHRDFRLNAMALPADAGPDAVIDPAGGRQDLAERRIRHVGASFVADPLRVLRGARLAAQLPDFAVAPETLDLFRALAIGGALDGLPPERVWRELEKALAAARPARFVEVLRMAGALRAVLPEIDALFGVPQRRDHHPEVDAGVHTLLVLDQATGLTADPVLRFAALVHDLGKGLTPCSRWPRHPGHEEAGVPVVEALVRRLHGPNRFREIAAIVTRWHGVVHQGAKLRPGTVLGVLEAAGALQHPERLEELLTVCLADKRGRLGFEAAPYPAAGLWRRALAEARGIAAADLLAAGVAPSPRLGELLFQRRAMAIGRALRTAAAHD
ncbi:MAG TPA: HD domain-containing protein [Geminicoccaceae bacterium]|nr:HD domain-containing protein [Geminicoccaceae bacterium]